MLKIRKKNRLDKELEQYRSLLSPPSEYKNGFGWSTVAGIFFCGLVMLPGSIYLGLMTGVGMGPAATWVTVILFMEISRRAMKAMGRQELVTLLHAANIMIAANVIFPGGPFGEIVYRAFLVTSDAIRDSGMAGSFPAWSVPSPDSPAIVDRNLFHIDWLIPIALVFFVTIIGKLNSFTLGYFFFRVTSDIEKLPFPMAPIAAQGSMALSEADEPPAGASEGSGAVSALVKNVQRKKSSRWRLFSLGASLGIAFGMFQVGIPSVSGLFFERPFFLIPQPFIDLTTLTEAVFPATPMGVVVDLGIILIGMIIPFWAVIGTASAVLLMFLINPLLYRMGFLYSWQPGMSTVNTTFANSVDFWLSFGIGVGLAISVVSIFSVVRDVIRKSAERRQALLEAGSVPQKMFHSPRGRGDYPLWIALGLYCVGAIAMIVLCRRLVPQLPLSFLAIFAFIYNPFISYVNARLLGLSGQAVDIPFVRETSFILSGARGLNLWLAPIPIGVNYGHMAQGFRINELTGVNFFSLIKAELIAVPLLFVLSFAFWAFIWHSNPVPSEIFPAARINWELSSKNAALLYSSTFESPGNEEGSGDIRDSEFMKAIHPRIIGSGFVATVISFAALSFFGLPVLLIYGFVKGIGQLPHYFILEMVGALVGRYYFQKRYGADTFLRMAPIVAAGYFTGVGLIGMATIALKLISEAVSGLPF
jgi:hypothetical protein